MNATNNNIKRKSKAAVPESWIYILGGILVSVVVYPFMDEMIPHREGPATLLTAGLTLAAAYFGRTWGQYMTAGKKNIHSGWIFFMVVLLVALVSWIFLVTQYPIGRKNGMNLFFLGLPLLISGMLVGLLTYILTNSIRKNLEQAKVTATQSQSELSLLHSQLSPHFLFNTLNNMYGISITNHEKLPALLLKLSELLRYSLYQVQDEFVPVKNEIAYLENYIEFERLRMGNRLQL
ncbi:MAG: histidine kinase, partial [Flavitalea sp.]